MLRSDEVGLTPTPASPSATGKAVNLRKVRGEKRAPQLRSIQRLARCVESGDYAELPQGYAWLAVGLEPSSCMEGGRPHLIEILTEGRQPQAAAAEQKQIEKLNAEQPLAAAEQKPIEKLNAEQKPIEKQNAEPIEKQNAEQNLAAAEQKPIEKQNAEPEAANPSKKKKSRLPRVSDFVPMIPGPLGPKVDPSDF